MTDTSLRIPTTTEDRIVKTAVLRAKTVHDARVAADRRFVADIEDIMRDDELGVSKVADILGASRTNIHRLLRLYGTR